MEVFLSEAKTLHKEIKELKNQKEELKTLLTKKQDDFKSWLGEKFKKPNIYNGNTVVTSDDVNEYIYQIEKNIFTLKKIPKSFSHGMSHSELRNHGGFFHPFHYMQDMMFEMMKMNGMETEETVYENNQKPIEKEKENIFELLKEDMVNNGEISQTIKNYITVDLTFRIELQNTIRTLENQIRDKEQIKKRIIVSEFSGDNLNKRLNANQTLTLEDGYKFKQFKQEESPVVSITLKNGSSSKILIVIKFENGEEKTTRMEKNYFNVTEFIKN